MALGHGLIPIALLSAPATPVLANTKGCTDRRDGPSAALAERAHQIDRRLPHTAALVCQTDTFVWAKTSQQESY